MENKNKCLFLVIISSIILGIIFYFAKNIQISLFFLGMACSVGVITITENIITKTKVWKK